MNKGAELQTLIDVMKAAAEKATPGEWHKGRQDPVTGIIKVYARTGSAKMNCIVKTDAHEVGFGISEREHKANAELIALANPANIRTLIAALEQAQHEKLVNWEAATSLVEENEELKRRIAELQQQLISPLPIGELLQRLENQTGQKWARQLSVKLPAGTNVNGFQMLIESEVVAYLQAVGIRAEVFRAAGCTVEGSE